MEESKLKIIWSIIKKTFCDIFNVLKREKKEIETTVKFDLKSDVNKSGVKQKQTFKDNEYHSDVHNGDKYYYCSIHYHGIPPSEASDSCIYGGFEKPVKEHTIEKSDVADAGTTGTESDNVSHEDHGLFIEKDDILLEFKKNDSGNTIVKICDKKELTAKA